jgi:hypothetical protein
MPNRRKLEVEELEPRFLLSGAGFCPHGTSPQASGAGGWTSRAAVGSSVVDPGGSHAGAVEQGWTGRGSAVERANTVAAPATPVAATVEVRTTSLRTTAEVARGPQPNTSQATAIAPTPQGPTESSGTGVASVQPAAETPAESSEPQAVVERPSVGGLLVLENLLVSGVLPALVSGLAAAGPPVGGGREVLALDYLPGLLLPLSPLPRTGPSPMNTPDGTGTAKGPGEEPSQVSDVLTALAPGDLSALERGLLHFLERLGPAGSRPAGDREGTTLYPWVVAGAAAVAACEIARRQLRRSVAEPAHEPLGG